jgi:hypothetical protein
MEVAAARRGPGGALLARLDAIAASLAARDHTLALIGLGSVGTELDRLDALSDLDFFVIVESPHQRRFIEDLDWLCAVAPIAFSLKNTRDGQKVLFEDGIYAEFAVFSPEEVSRIAVTGARVVWQADGQHLGAVSLLPPPSRSDLTVDFLAGEIVTNLYVGLQRYERGEGLSALRFIQGHAVDSLITLVRLTQAPVTGHTDPFDGARRFEQQYPAMAPHLPGMLQGYEGCVASALAILDVLKERMDVDRTMEQRIRDVAARVNRMCR